MFKKVNDRFEQRQYGCIIDFQSLLKMEQNHEKGVSPQTDYTPTWVLQPHYLACTKRGTNNIDNKSRSS